jgi:PAT family beta-lactamase induction signal transducer AmpG
MTTPSEEKPFFRVFFSARMLTTFLMGFYGGLPLLLTGSLMQAWMKKSGIDLATIGLFAMVGLPYTLKFLWAPVFDRYRIPWLGRRRGWLLLAQALLAAAIAALAFAQPGESPYALAAIAMLVAFFSASQDTVIDAYRRESLADLEQGLGSSLYINGYRLGMLLASGGGLILAGFIGFKEVYLVMAAVMLGGLAVTFYAAEPEEARDTPRTLGEAVVQPFLQFFQRREAWWILGFILLYKMGDTVASQMTTPFYLDMGFSTAQIGAVVKLFGFWATLLGGLAGGALIMRFGIYATLWQFGLLQALSTAAFAILTHTGANLAALMGVISFENLSAGMGSASFIAFMASQTDKRFTATQYALLSSLMGVPRVFIAAPSGIMASALGWEPFFLACAAMAIPGLLVLLRFRDWLGKPA